MILLGFHTPRPILQPNHGFAGARIYSLTMALAWGEIQLPNQGVQRDSLPQPNQGICGGDPKPNQGAYRDKLLSQPNHGAIKSDP
ncbi:hypothetical protein Dalk_0562 [Desulfatibacillum aliphaticivorans]|uniref:Uncharacterized protein n=1 Tax=Desulfatibacillum aliphaticivorans TaxID=218208 RepID=B8FHI0_DESAL|nr:hypothetical protein Dalk_0562 [Desulfatibacillum aliphaticivorans]